MQLLLLACEDVRIVGDANYRSSHEESSPFTEHHHRSREYYNHLGQQQLHHHHRTRRPNTLLDSLTLHHPIHQLILLLLLLLRLLNHLRKHLLLRLHHPDPSNHLHFPIDLQSTPVILHLRQAIRDPIRISSAIITAKVTIKIANIKRPPVEDK